MERAMFTIILPLSIPLKSTSKSAPAAQAAPAASAARAEAAESTASYDFTDFSVTRPLLTRVWFARLFPLVPRWLAANFVTLISCGSLLTVLALSLAPSFFGWSPTTVALVFFAALQFYVAGDHLDGMQAVATRTTSPLGDFLDHYCDFWAGCILVFGLWSLVGSAGSLVLYTLMGLLVLSFAATYAEREAEQKLHFAKWGALEANLILSLFLLSWAIPSARAFWLTASPLSVPWYLFAIAIVAAMALGTVVVIVRRMGRITPPLGVTIAATVALVIFVTRQREMPAVEGWLLVAMFGGRYVAQVMHGYLVPGRRSWPDPIATIAIFFLLLWDVGVGIPAVIARQAVMALDGYLAAVLLMTAARILVSLRRYWVWVNRGGVS
jgi:ethanolaminephosphotransferase